MKNNLSLTFTCHIIWDYKTPFNISSTNEAVDSCWIGGIYQPWLWVYWLESHRKATSDLYQNFCCNQEHQIWQRQLKSHLILCILLTMVTLIRPHQSCSSSTQRTILIYAREWLKVFTEINKKDNFISNISKVGKVVTRWTHSYQWFLMMFRRLVLRCSAAATSHCHTSFLKILSVDDTLLFISANNYELWVVPVILYRRGWSDTCNFTTQWEIKEALLTLEG